MAKKQGKSTVELETKISMQPADLEKIFNYFAKKIGKKNIAHKYHPRDYYDTDNLDLYSRRISLRVQYLRGDGGVTGAYEQTVKFEVPKGHHAEDALNRKECKDDLPSHRPDISLISDKEALQAVDDLKGKKLKHVFTAAIERRFGELTVGKGRGKGRVEIAFDTGTILLPGNETYEKFYEIEIELKKGSARAIDFVRDLILEKAPSAKVQPLSKADQGCRLYLSNLAP